MKNFFGFVILFLSTTTNTTGAQLSQQQLMELLNHPNRLAKDNIRDSVRKPEKIMDFADVAAGDHVLDLYAGGGWYSELFSLAVGKNGLVYAHNDELTWKFGAQEIKDRSAGNRLVNLVRLDQVALADINVPTQSIDIAFMAINYHDLYFTCLLYTSPSPRDLSTSRMPSSA